MGDARRAGGLLEPESATSAPIIIIGPRLIAEQAARIDADDAILHALPENREPSSAGT